METLKPIGIYAAIGLLFALTFADQFEQHPRRMRVSIFVILVAAWPVILVIGMAMMFAAGFRKWFGKRPEEEAKR